MEKKHKTKSLKETKDRVNSQEDDVRYEIISNGKATRKSATLDGSGRSGQQQNHTMLQRLKSKLTRRSKSCVEEPSTFYDGEHVYDVPYAETENEGRLCRGHFYQNGNIWAQNNTEGDRRLPRQRNMDDIVGPKASREDIKLWQAKSMSLPLNTSSSAHRSSATSSGYSSSDDSPVNGINHVQRTQSLPVPPKFDINLNFLAGLNDLCKQGWYWGPLSCKEAECKLDGQPDGCFLVRDSNDNRYLLSLSFRSESKTLHTRIEFSRGKFSFYAAPFISSGCHESIVDLIEDCVEQSKEKVFCYSKGRGHQGLAFPVRLVKAVSRFDHVCTLQHLCRFIIRQHFTLENIHELPLPGMVKRYLNKNHFDGKQG